MPAAVPGSAALARVTALGPFFGSEQPSAGGPGPAGPSVAELCQPSVLRDSLALAREALPGGGDVSKRAAASVVSLGWIARLVAPSIGCALVEGELPVLHPDHVWLTAGGGLAVQPSGLGWSTGDGSGRLPAALDAVLLRGLVDPLVVALRELGISPVVLRGNVASAVSGALISIALARPEAAVAGRDLLSTLLSSGYLAGAGTVGDAGFRRRSCCQIWRLPAGGYCGDCVISPRRPVPSAD